MSLITRKLNGVACRLEKLRLRLVTETNMRRNPSSKAIKSIKRSIARLEKVQFILRLKRKGRTDGVYINGKLTYPNIYIDPVEFTTITRGLD